MFRLLRSTELGPKSTNQVISPGAIGVNWKEFFWDPYMRAFPSPDLFAERIGGLGVSNDTTVVIYGDPAQFGTYGWLVLKDCGHRDARLLDGGRLRWQAEGRSFTKDRQEVSELVYSTTDSAQECGHREMIFLRLWT